MYGSLPYTRTSDESCLPCTCALPILQVEAAYPVAARSQHPRTLVVSSLPYTDPNPQVRNPSRHPNRPKGTGLPYTIPVPAQPREPRPTSKSTKSNQPTLHSSKHKQQDLGLPNRNRFFNQVKPAYPAPADRRRRTSKNTHRTPTTP